MDRTVDCRSAASASSPTRTTRPSFVTAIAVNSSGRPVYVVPFDRVTTIRFPSTRSTRATSPDTFPSTLAPAATFPPCSSIVPPPPGGGGGGGGTVPPCSTASSPIACTAWYSVPFRRTTRTRSLRPATATTSTSRTRRFRPTVIIARTRCPGCGTGRNTAPSPPGRRSATSRGNLSPASVSTTYLEPSRSTTRYTSVRSTSLTSAPTSNVGAGGGGGGLRPRVAATSCRDSNSLVPIAPNATRTRPSRPMPTTVPALRRYLAGASLASTRTRCPTANSPAVGSAPASRTFAAGCDGAAKSTATFVVPGLSVPCRTLIVPEFTSATTPGIHRSPCRNSTRVPGGNGVGSSTRATSGRSNRRSPFGAPRSVIQPAIDPSRVTRPRAPFPSTITAPGSSSCSGGGTTSPP
jgi:hypothetical protein